MIPQSNWQIAEVNLWSVLHWKTKHRCCGGTSWFHSVRFPKEDSSQFAIKGKHRVSHISGTAKSIWPILFCGEDFNGIHNFQWFEEREQEIEFNCFKVSQSEENQNVFNQRKLKCFGLFFAVKLSFSNFELNVFVSVRIALICLVQQFWNLFCRRISIFLVPEGSHVSWKLLKTKPDLDQAENQISPSQNNGSRTVPEALPISYFFVEKLLFGTEMKSTFGALFWMCVLEKVTSVRVWASNNQKSFIERHIYILNGLVNQILFLSNSTQNWNVWIKFNRTYAFKAGYPSGILLVWPSTVDRNQRNNHPHSMDSFHRHIMFVKLLKPKRTSNTVK